MSSFTSGGSSISNTPPGSDVSWSMSNSDQLVELEVENDDMYDILDLMWCKT